MLVLSRKVMESIAIGENVVITLLGIRGNNVRIGIEAPREIHVRRTELNELSSKPSNGTVAASVTPVLLRDPSGGEGWNNVAEIEFVGGPFDGHKLRCSAPRDRLPSDLVWFVSENVYRMFGGQKSIPHKPITSVAVYQRKTRNGVVRYQFMRAVSMKELAFRSKFESII